MRPVPTLVALAGTIGLAACAVPLPSAPTVLALPPAGKDMSAFQQDDGSCRNYAQSAIGPQTPGTAAAQSAVGSAVVGTALGAAAGALIGSAAGAVGGGAAIGAGTGLLLGSAVGAGNAQATGASYQAVYNNAYTQCMVARGNTIQTRPVYPGPYYGYGYGYPGYYRPYYVPY